MKYSKFVGLGIALFSFLCLAGCSDGTSGSSSSGGSSNFDGNKGVLDLRIQNNGTTAGSLRTTEAGSSTAYEAETELVRAVAEKDGIHFTIKNPLRAAVDDKNFEKGSSIISVIRIENINGEDIETTCAAITNNPFHNWGNENESESDNEEVSFVYPLCEAGEIYKFMIYIEPLNKGVDNALRHYVTVKAKGRIGDIDYSNFSYGDWAFASYSNGKANVWIKNVIPPQAI